MTRGGDRCTSSDPQRLGREPLLTAAQVASQLAISARTVYDIPESRLPRYRLGAGRGAIRFAQADVDAYLASCRCAGTPKQNSVAVRAALPLSARDTDLRAYFRKAGVEPRLTPSGLPRPRKAQPKKGR